jgi:hypothetical protein
MADVQATGTSVQGEAAHDAAVVGNPLLLGARANNSAPTAVSGDGDVVQLWADRRGVLAASNIIPSGGTGNDATNLSGFTALDGTTIVTPTPSAAWVFNGSTWDRLRGSTSGAQVIGAAASDAAVAGNPLLMGGRASSAVPTAVSADGDAVAQWLDRNGATIVNGRDAHDAALDANTNPLLLGGRASTATPSAVSADGDAVRAWFGRLGQQVVAVGASVTPADGVSNTSFEVFPMGSDGVQGRVGVAPFAFNGSTWDRLRGSTNGLLVQGPAGADNAIAGNPLLAGGRASTTTPSAVSADGDAVSNWLTREGAQAVTPVPHTRGGLLIFRTIDLDETEEEVKATAGQVYGYIFSNLASSTRFLKFYNATAASVTVGSTTPVMTIALPGNTSDDITGHLLGGLGIEFDTAITIAATTGVLDSDTGAPGTNEVLVNVLYK